MSQSAALRSGMSGAWTMPSGGGFSEAAESLNTKLVVAYGDWFAIPSRKTKVDIANEKLRDISERTSATGWDGYDAPIVSGEAFDEAIEFLKMLPNHYPIPEIIADPTGAIGLEWYVGPGRFFAVSLHGNKSIEFMGMFAPGNEDFGRANFASLIPPKILESLSRFY